MLPLLNSGRITLPRHDRLIAQIVGLERRVSRAGRDSIDHAPGGHDDIANAVSGVIAAISGVGIFNFEFWHDDRAWNGGAPSSDELLCCSGADVHTRGMPGRFDWLPSSVIQRGKEPMRWVCGPS
jgi:hypothetical protein